MASIRQLRRARDHALANGWECGSGSRSRVFRTWPGGRVRAIEIAMTDTIRPRLETIRELDGLDGRRVSIRRAIRVFRAEYDETGETRS